MGGAVNLRFGWVGGALQQWWGVLLEGLCRSVRGL